MKKRIRQISKLIPHFISSFAISAMFLTSISFAQGGATRLTQKTDIWYAFYSITMKGSGIQQPEIGSDGPEITWSLNRSYSGSVRLENGVRVADTRWSDKERTESIWTERKIRFTDKSPQVHVQIKDYIRRKFDPTCEEYTTEIETWEADVQGNTGPRDEATLAIDNKYSTHDVVFPTMYFPKGTAADLKHEKTTFYFPKGTMSPTQTDYLNLASHRIPDIMDWLRRNGETTRDNQPMKKNEDGKYIFKTDKPIIVNESLLPGVVTSGKVTIEIIYTIRKNEN